MIGTIPVEGAAGFRGERDSGAHIAQIEIINELDDGAYRQRLAEFPQFNAQLAATHHLLQRSVPIQARHKEPDRVLFGRYVLECGAHLVENMQHKATLAQACCLAGQQAVGGQLM